MRRMVHHDLSAETNHDATMTRNHDAPDGQQKGTPRIHDLIQLARLWEHISSTGKRVARVLDTLGLAS